MNSVNNQIVITADGSSTLYNARNGEHYHSTFGAIQESRHIFIEAGLRPCLNQSNVCVFEVGFGTGLNALLTMQAGEEKQVKIHYTAIELYPVSADETEALNYADLLNIDIRLFRRMHESAQSSIPITPLFYLDKQLVSFQDTKPEHSQYDVVFFDAFSPEAQPEMWTEQGFKKLYEALKPGGILVTYSSKGLVKRALQSVGFRIEKLPGPPGKREFLRAWKESF